MSETVPTPPTPLTPIGTRALVATMLRGTAAGPDLPMHTATLAVDTLDALSRALLVDVLGATPNEARALAADLDKPLYEATAADLDAWVRRLVHEVSPAGRAQYIGDAQLFYRWALAQRRVAVDPAAD